MTQDQLIHVHVVLVYCPSMVDREAIRQRWELFGSKLDERGQRHFAAVEAMTAGRGGVVAVHKITGIARSTIGRGLDELNGAELPDGRVRREGGGRREVADIDPTLVTDLQRLVEPVTMGDPERPLKWVSKSPVKLADELRKQGHEVSPNTVSRLLSERLEYSRQVNRKTHEGASHPDRNAQFEHINAKVAASMAAGVPVISVDTKKKELIGNFRNGGSDWRPKGDPHRVKVHDFEDKQLGKVVPYGIYDIAANAGWVSLGITSDTAEFAVASIRTWIDRIGCVRYPGTRELRITADCGGSNGARVRLWKAELQKLADTTGLNAARQPLSAGYLEVEQDRASAVLPHHSELAWPAAGESSGGHRAHRPNHDQDRLEGRVCSRRADVREGHQDQQGRDAQACHPGRCVSPRMELHHQAA